MKSGDHCIVSTSRCCDVNGITSMCRSPFGHWGQVQIEFSWTIFQDLEKYNKGIVVFEEDMRDVID